MQWQWQDRFPGMHCASNPTLEVPVNSSCIVHAIRSYCKRVRCSAAVRFSKHSH